MPAFTIEQWAVIGLVFVAGWLLGLASHSGGRKWRERYAAEREAHASARRDADARVVAAEKHSADLEREHARVLAATPVAAPVAPTRPIVARPARPAYAAGERPGWFDWNARR